MSEEREVKIKLGKEDWVIIDKVCEHSGSTMGEELSELINIVGCEEFFNPVLQEIEEE